MEAFLVDLRHTLRALGRDRGLVLLAIAALAMGIGFPTTMFSIVHGGTRALPFADSDELVIVTHTFPERGIDNIEPLPWDVTEWRTGESPFEDLAAFRMEAFNLAGPGLEPERRSGTRITVQAFDILGIGPILGRGFRSEDALAGADDVVLLSHALWQSRFAGDPTVVGREIRMDARPYTVLGVMPEEFGFPINSDLWVPFAIDASAAPGQGTSMTVFGRLRDGVTLDAARATMAGVAQRQAAAQPATHAGFGIRVFPFVEMETDPSIVRVLYLMVTAVSLVLLIACANVANMLLARAVTRTREVAVRTALGASRRRIVLQHLAETAAIALIGGLLGVGAAWIGVSFFDRMSADIIEAFWVDFRVDGTVLVFAAGLIGIAAVAAGIGPALQASRANVASVLKESTPGAPGLRMGRISRGLVVAELALSCGLLAVAAVIVRTATALRAVDMPFAVEEILTAQFAVPQETLGDVERRNLLVSTLAERLESAPGIRAAALTSALPGRGSGNWSFQLDDVSYDDVRARPTSAVAFVTPDYFDVLDARVVRGRGLTWADGPDALKVVLVNESWVTRFSSDADPIGRRVRLDPNDEGYTVVGVVPDLLADDVESRQQDGMYFSMLQGRPYSVRALVRTAGPALGGVSRLRTETAAVDPDLPVFEILPLRDAIYADKKVLDAFATLFGLFGLGALFLTTTGLYGVIAFGVSQREREMGVRKALGASSGDIVGLVLRQGSRQLALGFLFGLGLALALARVIAAGLHDVDPLDPVVFASVFGALALTGLAALIVPARRAAAVTPAEALRRE